MLFLFSSSVHQLYQDDVAHATVSSFALRLIFYHFFLINFSTLDNADHSRNDFYRRKKNKELNMQIHEVLADNSSNKAITLSIKKVLINC